MVRLIDANTVVESLTNFTPNGWGKDVPYIRSEWAAAVKINDNFMKAITEAPLSTQLRLYGAKIVSIIIGNKNPVMERLCITASCLI